MVLFEKISNKINTLYKKRIVYEDYPMQSFISRYQLRKKGFIGVVYMLHHIANKDHRRLPPNEDLKVSPSFLEKTISKYKKLGFEFISLDKLHDILYNNDKIEKPFIAFTIDDGYKDNYINALPVFEKWNVPFAIFITTDFIDSKAILWWESIEDLILSKDSITINNSTVFQCHTYQQKWDTFRSLRERILNINQESLVDKLNEMFSKYEIKWYYPIEKSAMTWEQIKKISENSLCTIGGHTVSHPALNKLTKEELYNEIYNGIKKLEEITNKKINHFAYPYGSANEIGEREISMVSELGLKTAYKSYGGYIMEDVQYNKYNLPRLFLHDMG